MPPNVTFEQSDLELSQTINRIDLASKTITHVYQTTHNNIPKDSYLKLRTLIFGICTHHSTSNIVLFLSTLEAKMYISFRTKLDCVPRLISKMAVITQSLQ